MCGRARFLLNLGAFACYGYTLTLIPSLRLTGFTHLILYILTFNIIYGCCRMCQIQRSLTQLHNLMCLKILIRIINKGIYLLYKRNISTGG